MRHRNVPYRQCVSCRKVFPKRELLRFVQCTAGETAFDEQQKARGRGFYLCPEQRCFTDAWKNRKVRLLIRDEDAGERLLKTVRTGLLRTVEDLVQTGFGATMDGSHEALEKGDILLAREEMGGRQLKSLLDTAQEKGFLIFVVPRTVLRGEETAAITKKSPKMLPLLRNLRFYERLSSKGRAL